MTDLGGAIVVVREQLGCGTENRAMMEIKEDTLPK